MATQDLLEIISPGGDVQFYSLDPAKGVTNIGRHPDNDIVIESADVAPFHAVLVHGQKPYHLTLLDPSGKTRVAGQAVAPNAPYTLRAWDTIELDGCSLVFMEDAAGSAPAGPVIVRAGAPGPVPLPPRKAEGERRKDEIRPAGAVLPPSTLIIPPSPEAPLPPSPEAPLPPSAFSLPPSSVPVVDQSDECILVELSQREFTVDVEQLASFDVTLVNGGDIVATMVVSVEGLPTAWVQISPPAVNLNEGERAVVSVTITPPRLPSTRAGTHYFGLAVNSPNYPGRLSRTGAALQVNPFFEYTVDEISPRQQNIPWGRRMGRAAFSLANLGNSDIAYRLDANDDENACQFEFQVSADGASLARQAEVRLAPEESCGVGLTIAPLRRRFFGFSGHTHSYTVNVTPLEGIQTPRSVLAQAQSLPLIGPYHVMALVLLLIVLIALAFRPSVSAFAADPPEVLSSEIMGGKMVALSYRVSWFARATIDQEVGRQPEAQGVAEVAPTKTTTYRLTATDFLTFLYPPWFSDSREITVVVDPVTPIVRFSVDRDRMIVGETVTLSWEVLNADVVVLKTNGAPETLPPERHTGSLEVSPELETTYTLEARNAYTTGDGIVQTIVVNATTPTPTPLPLPVIQRFDALPNPITAGEEVTLEWSVVGVEEVQIEPLGNFPPSGRTVVKPDQTTAYQLVASNGQAPPVRSLREVVVNPAPTATPVPGSPVIQLFTASTNEVFLGSDEADNVQLAWSVTGEVAGIELSGETLGKLSGLERQGSRIVSVNDAAGDHEFILTANNGAERTASQSVVISVIVPVPAISGLSPSSATVGGPGFTLTVTGANFLPGSTVRWNGVDRPTTFVNGFQLTASIPAGDIAETGVFMVTVFNPATAGGGVSPASLFKVNNPTPVLTASTPITATVGDPDLTVVLTGSGFIPDSVVRFNGADLQTTYSSTTELRAVIPEDSMTESGTFTLTVFNPEPVGGSSGGLTFTVFNPTPTITSLGPPSFVTVGGSAFTLTILGTGFVGGDNGSEVSWGGSRRQPIFINETQLQLTLPTEDLAEVKTVQVAVINDQPGTSPSVSNAVSYEIGKNTTSVTVSASPFSGVSGEEITFTAYVHPGPGALQGPLVGSVIFKQGGNTSTVAVSGDPPAASFTDRFPAGQVSITAEYDGNDPNFQASTFTPYNYTVGQADVLVTVSTVANPSSYGAGVQYTATVTAADPGSNDPVRPTGGKVTFTFDGGALGGPVTDPENDGTFVITTTGAVMTVGKHSITASYDGADDPNFNSGDSLPFIHEVTKITPFVNLLTSLSSPSTYGQGFTLSATVQALIPGFTLTPANGTPVTFTATKSGVTTTVGTGFLTGGVAHLDLTGTQLDAGSYSFTASFPGDTNFNSATSSGVAYLINKTSTSVALGAISPSPSLRGQSISLQATVTAGSGAPTPQGGTITFYDFGTPLATVNANFGSASYSPTLAQLFAGGHSFTAVFNGYNPNYNSSPTSSAVGHAVNKNTPQFMLRNSVTGSSAGFVQDSGRVTWTVSVTAGSAFGVPGPTGTVTFYYYSNWDTDHCHPYSWHFNLFPLGYSPSIVNGEASFIKDLAAHEGSNRVYVSYGGDANYTSASAEMISNNAPGVTCNDP